MEHLIRFRTAEGIEGSHVAAQLDEAVAFVERLRNAEGASDVRLYRLTEIPIEFKPYYRVEVGTSEAATPSRPSPSPQPPPVPDQTARAPADAGPRFTVGRPESAAADGRRLFSRG